MEKRCEFCKALRAVVLCKSDAAHLCLSCDAKVHSANALSYRHPRTLVCESCRFQPALVRCFDHQMFMCQSCDMSHHVSLDHRKKIVSCYVGCPSAKDLAHLWGFDFKDVFNSTSEASSGGMKLVSHLILQQILELSEGIDDSCLAHVTERSPPLRHDEATWKEHRMVEMNNHLDHSADAPLLEPLPSPFSQLDNLTNTGNPLNGDAFWQYRNNEIWPQNMQDLGVCDEVECFDDVTIPDVDLTFRNFEEVFGNEDNKHPSFEQGNDPPPPIRPSYSVSSFSVSRITGESSGSEDLSPTFPAQRVSCDLDSTTEAATLSYKEKKIVSRHEKQGHYTSPRFKSDFKKRGKSQVLQVQGLEADSGTF